MRSKLLLLILLICFYKGNAQKSYATFNHIAIYVKDLNRSVAFYSILFQFDSIADPFPDRKITWLKIGDSQEMHIIQSARDTIIPQDTYHFCFSVVSIEDFILHLNKNHIEYTGNDMKTSKVVARQDGIKQIWFKDPDGYTVEVNDAKQK